MPGAAAPPAAEPAAPAEPVMKMKDDPRYARYFKMVQIGVPMAQVKQKMMMEGVNPDILDNPDAPADAVKDTPAPATADDSSDEESSDSFS